MIRALWLVLIVLLAGAALDVGDLRSAAADQTIRTADQPLSDPALEARARALMREIRCVVCQSQSIDESDADIAANLRNIVREQLAAGKSEAEIRAYLTARYGDFVLLDRPGVDVAEIVHHQDVMASDVHAVGGLEQLDAEAGGRIRLQPFVIAIIFPEDAGRRHVMLEQRPQGERRTEVTGMQDHPNSPAQHLAHQAVDRREPVVGVGEETDEHQVIFHSRPMRSSRVRSRYSSRSVVRAHLSPSTSTSAALGRAL